MYGEWILQWLWIPVLTAVAAQDVRAAVPPNRNSPNTPTIESRIRVRLVEAAPVVALRGFDLRISAPGTEGRGSRRLASSPDGLSSWEIRCQHDRVRAIRMGGGGQALDLPAPVSIESRAGFIQFRGRPYREEIRIHAAGSLCEVVNRLDIEKYLGGLVNAEFSSRWNAEAIEAQVVAARTYAFHQIREARELHFDVDATVRDQVYGGSYREDTRASRSVERTRGVVLTVADGRTPLKAFYHSTCAGRTQLPENVWGAAYPGFTRTVPCPYCAHSPVLNWELDVTTRDLAKALLRGGRREEFHPGWPSDWMKILGAGKLLDLRVVRLDREGRVAEVKTSWSLGGALRELSMTGPRLRNWLGPARFRSASFQVTALRGAPGGDFSRRWHFEGRGNGHGVGMCQYGAKAMGEKGFRMAAILKHYYPDAILRKLW